MIALALLLAAAPAPKLLVLDFRDDGVGANAVHIIHDTLASHLSEDTRLEVISSEDMRRALDVDAQKRALGACDNDGCLAEIAEALGAQLTMYGTAGKLGDLVVVNVSLYDARAAKSVGRKTIEVKALDQLPPLVRAAGDELIAKLPGLAPPETKGPGVMTWTGVAVAGVGVAAGAVGAVVALANADAEQKAEFFRDKVEAQKAADTATAVAVIGAGVAVVGAGVMAIGLLVE